MRRNSDGKFYKARGRKNTFTKDGSVFLKSGVIKALFKRGALPKGCSTVTYELRQTRVTPLQEFWVRHVRQSK